MFHNFFHTDRSIRRMTKEIHGISKSGPSKPIMISETQDLNRYETSYFCTFHKLYANQEMPFLWHL